MALASLRKWMKNVSDYVATTSQPTPIYKSGSVTVNGAKYYNLVTVTLPANSKYLVFGNVVANVSGSTILLAILVTSSTAKLVYSGMGRGTINSGGGTHAWAYIETGDTDVDVTLQSYGYLTSNHTETGKILAIPISYLQETASVLTPEDLHSEVDYVVEQGTDDIWTYRKWNSGIAECWGTETKKTAIATAWGNAYCSPSLSTSFPTGLFIKEPDSVSLFATGAFSCWVDNSDTFTKDLVKYSLLRPNSLTTSYNYNVRIHAIGKWK